VLHLHDGAVHQDADGDGDSSQRHDVGGDAHEIHGDESQDDGDGNGDDGDDGGRDVPKEDQDDQADDDHLQKQLFPQVRDGLFDQVRTVIGGNQIHSLGEGSLDAPDPLLDAVDDVEGVLAIAHHHDPPHRVPHPVQVHYAAADVGAHLHPGHVAHQDGCPFAVVPHRDLLQVFDGARVAATSHHVFGAGEL